MTPYVVHPIEVESYQILSDRVDLSGHSDVDQAIIGRMIHATADLSFAESARIGPKAGERLTAAIAAGAPVIVDAAMIAAGITRYPTQCYLPRVPVAPAGSTRSAAAFELACREHSDGAVFVVGNAPTALFELIRLHEAGLVRPAAVVGLPVGFVGAKESKAALLESKLAPISISNVGERGGSPPAAGAVNAIVRRVHALSPQLDTEEADTEQASVLNNGREGNKWLPVVLSVGGKRCVVVGGGKAGQRKARALVNSGAVVTVIDPRAVPISGAKRLQRRWEPGDSIDAIITVVATDDAVVNRAIAADAKGAGSLVLRTDLPFDSDVQFSATHRSGTVTVSVSTGGASPTLSVYLRDKIALNAGHWADLADWARRNRPVTKAQIATHEATLRRKNSK